jgi:TRAP-type C4-dicarboxylate transport system substrate-binding protein
MRLALGAALALGLAASAIAVPAPAADIDTSKIDEREFTVVGTWGNLALWQDHESRLWNEVLPEASGGRITANAKPYTELGISGFEVMRLLELGTYDAVHALTSYTSQDSPALEGLDLGGVIQDLETYRKAADAYEPVLRRELADKYNAELIMLYTFPSQQFWCKLDDPEQAGLDSIAGKKVRSYSTTQGDFIEGLGGTPVTIAFAEVVPALEKGVVDCGITGTEPAYNAKWWQVANTNIRSRIGYAATFLAINKDTWASLSPETQELIKQKAAEVEAGMWEATAVSEQVGMDCNASGPCPLGDPGGMTPIELSPEDEAKLSDVVENVVLKRFVERCGMDCAKEWNETVGKISGHEAPL